MGSTSPPTAQLAADKLWQFQMRKENKAILEQMKEIERRNLTAAKESERKTKANEEKIDALEAKVAELEQQQLRKDQEHEKHRRERIAHKAQLEKGVATFLRERGNISEEEIRDIMAGRVPSRSPTNQQGPQVPSKEIHSSKDPSSRRPRPVVMHRTSEEERLLVIETPKSSNRGATSKGRGAETVRGPNISDRLAEPTDALLSNTVFPRLEQGMSVMRVYYDRTTEIFKSLRITNEATEIDFVNTFIRGITAPKTKEKLLAHLQQIHPSKNKKGGIEVLCDWSDVEEGLKKTGLLGEKEAEIGRKKRNLNPRGLIETSFHH